MHFGHYPSGGRGEYEIAGVQGQLTAADLTNHQLLVDLPNLGVKNTHLVVKLNSGKRRVRRVDPNQPDPMIQLQVAAILLLPESTRDRHTVSNGKPIAIAKKYVIDKIDFEIETLTTDTATLALKSLDLISSISDDSISETFDFGSRLARVRAITDRADELPASIAQKLHEHSIALNSDAPGRLCAKPVKDLMKVAAAELPLYLPTTDPLPAIEAYLGLSAPSVLNPAEIAEDEISLRRRAAAQMRMQVARGASAARFRKLVQAAYDNRCSFCGVRLPKNDACSTSGVDAAHILPWAEYDLDVVRNGIMLCKIHHWAFDQQVLVLTHSNGLYSVSMPTRVSNVYASDPHTLSELTRHIGPISSDRIPNETSKRPSPDFIHQLYSLIPPEQS